MAGDWIKLEHTTPDKPEVIKMAMLLKLDQDSVAGKLLRVWIWADQNSIDGNVISITEAFIDRIAFHQGFAVAMREVGWIAGDDGLLSFPSFQRHNGTTAKSRAQTNRRVAKCRETAKAKSPQSSSNAFVTLAALQKPLPEKRRVQSTDDDEKGSPPDNPNEGSITRLHPYCTQLEAEQWAERHNRNALDGVRITPEIIVSWWESRTRSEWQVVKKGALIPLTTCQATETDLIAYARSWARNLLKPKIQYANHRPSTPARSDAANPPGRYATPAAASAS